MSRHRFSAAWWWCALLLCLAQGGAVEAAVERSQAEAPARSLLAAWERSFLLQQEDIDSFNVKLAISTTTTNTHTPPPPPPPLSKPISTQTAPAAAAAVTTHAAASPPAPPPAPVSAPSPAVTSPSSSSSSSVSRPSRPVLPASARGRPLVTLCMIVKDEAHSLAATLESVRGWVDRYSILDTGSTDGTVALLTGWFEQYLEADMWRLHQAPFVDFASTRNQALALAGQQAEFILFLNGDDRLVGGAAMRRFLEQRRSLTADDEAIYIVAIDYGGISMGRSERLSRSANHAVADWPNDPMNHWRYEGVTHEVYVCQRVLQAGAEMVYTPDLASGDADAFQIYHDITYDTPVAKQARFELDVQLLEAELASDPEQKQPNRARSLFYLGQTFFNLRRAREAFATFEQRVATNYPRPTRVGQDNEKAKAYGMMATMAPALGLSRQRMADLLAKAHEHCPTSYSAMQLARFFLEVQPSDEAKARRHAKESRRLLADRRLTSEMCADDPQLVARQLPALFTRLQIKYA